jgi:hypothetical protein
MWQLRDKTQVLFKFNRAILRRKHAGWMLKQRWGALSKHSL